MARSTSASTTSATPTEIFSDLMSKFMIHSPSSDLTWKQKDTPAEYSFDATSFASQQIHLAAKYEEMQILFEGLSFAPVIFWTSKPNFQVIQKSWEKSVEVKNEIGEYLRQIRA